MPIPSTRYGCRSLVGLRRVHGPFGVDADDLHLGLVLLEVAADAADRAAGADRDHDRVELAAGLLPDLRPGRAVVRLGVRHVRVLVGLEPARDLLREPRRDRVVRLGRVVLDRRRRDHDLGAVAAQHRDLLLAHLVGHHEDAPVALLCRRDREADAGVARGRLDDRAAGLQLPVALGGFDHREPDPVLVRPARVQELELGEDRPRHVARDAVEPDDRRVADQVDHGWVVAGHGRAEAYPPLRRRHRSFRRSRELVAADQHERCDQADQRDADGDPERELAAACERHLVERPHLRGVRRSA